MTKTSKTMFDEQHVYMKIGMAIISAQRVEFVTRQLLEHLKEFDKDIYGITPSDFLDDRRHNKKFKTLGDIFSLLNINSKLVIDDEMTNYKNARNVLAHSFWKDFLYYNDENQVKLAIDFCNDFGRASDRMEKFFKGFIYFLALRHDKDRDALDETLYYLSKDFDYFITSLQKKKLN